MSDSKFDGIEDLTEVKYDPADPYKHRRKKISCKFCPKFISSRNMSTHVKTVHADVEALVKFAGTKIFATGNVSLA